MRLDARLRRVETIAAERRAANYYASPEGQREVAETVAAMWYSTLAYEPDADGIIRPRGWAGDALCGVAHEAFVTRIIESRCDVGLAAASFQPKSEVLA